MAIINGEVTVGTSAVAIGTFSGEVLLQNVGTAAVFIGSTSSVTTSGANEGEELPANMTSPLTFPVGSQATIYGISGTAGQVVLFWTFNV